MALCRWSSLDYQCDLYVYQSEDGYTVHFAGRHTVWTPPESRYDIHMAFGDIPNSEWNRRIDAYWAALEEADHEPIDHPWAGESVWGLSPLEAYEICEQAMAEGFRATSSLLPLIYMEMMCDHYGIELWG